MVDDNGFHKPMLIIASVTCDKCYSFSTLENIQALSILEKPERKSSGSITLADTMPMDFARKRDTFLNYLVADIMVANAHIQMNNETK